MKEIVDKNILRRRDLIGWVRSISLAILAALFLTQVVLINAQVPTNSMEDTIMIGDRVIGVRLAYQFHEPEREDIAIFYYPDDETQFYVKRIIGLPGDTVEIINGEVYINGKGEPLDSGYVKGELQGNYGPYQVPEGHYFMLGDNRLRSWDSRFWENTYVAREKILGKVVMRAYPDPKWLE